MRKQFEKHRTVLYTNTGAGNWAKVTISTFALLHSCYKPDSVRDYFEKDARKVTKDEEFFGLVDIF